MNNFLIVVGIAAFAALLTWLGVPVAEHFDVPHRVISAALQFAAGIITALVAIRAVGTAPLAFVLITTITQRYDPRSQPRGRARLCRYTVRGWSFVVCAYDAATNVGRAGASLARTGEYHA